MSNVIKIALLIVGALLVALIVRTVIASASQPAQPQANWEKVRVATADLPQGLLLRDEDLKWLEVAPDKVPAGAVLASAKDSVDLKGALLRHPVTAGTVLVGDDVILPNAPGFLAATLKPDMRAISVAVDEVSGNAGLIEPGDYVDLLLTQQMAPQTEGQPRSVVTETVVEHVRVLASGSEIIRPKSGDASTDLHQRARTVTLEVTPHMGEVISVAAKLGSLSLALRSFATAVRDPSTTLPGIPATTRETANTAPVWSSDVSRAFAKPTPVAVAAVRDNAPVYQAPKVVMIYRGVEKSDSTGGTGTGGNAGAPVGGPPPLPAAVQR